MSDGIAMGNWKLAIWNRNKRWKLWPIKTCGLTFQGPRLSQALPFTALINNPLLLYFHREVWQAGKRGRDKPRAWLGEGRPLNIQPHSHLYSGNRGPCQTWGTHESFLNIQSDTICITGIEVAGVMVCLHCPTPILTPIPMKLSSIILCRSVSTEPTSIPIVIPIPMQMGTVPNLTPILVLIRWYCSWFPLLLCIRIIMGIIGITITISPSVAFLDFIGIVIEMGVGIGVGKCKRTIRAAFQKGGRIREDQLCGCWVADVTHE